MRCNSFIKAQITIIVIAILYGCSPTSVPVSNEPVSVSNTITPVPSVISSSTAENVVLLHTFSGHSKRVLDVAFSAQGEFLASSSQDMNIKLWDVKGGQEVHTFRTGNPIESLGKKTEKSAA
jgi:WD40 repeat protein